MEFLRSVMLDFLSTLVKVHVILGASDLFCPRSLPFFPQQLVGGSQGYTGQTSGNSERVSFLAISNLSSLTEMQLVGAEGSGLASPRIHIFCHSQRILHFLGRLCCIDRCNNLHSTWPRSPG